MVKVSVPPNTDKEKIHQELNQNYDLALKAIEEKYKAQLQAKDQQIDEYLQNNANLHEIIKLQAQQSINIKVMNNSTD